MFDALGPILSSSFQRAPWGWGTFGLLILGYWKIRPLMQGLADKREANLLTERAVEMASMRERLDKQEEQIALLNEELRIVRHDLANSNTVIDMLIARVESATDVDEMKRQAASLSAERTRQKQQMDQERSDLRKVRLGTIGGRA